MGYIFQSRGIEEPSHETNFEIPEILSPSATDTPEKLLEGLSQLPFLKEEFSIQVGGSELVVRLNENKEGLIFRGMPPQDVFSLLMGKNLYLKPYRYENAGSFGGYQDLQNASFLYSNAIMHGSDPRPDEDFCRFLSAVGFSSKDPTLVWQATGKKLVERFAEMGETNFLPSYKEADVSVEGYLTREKLEAICFRFRVGDEFITVYYKRKREKDWQEYQERLSYLVKQGEIQEVQELLEESHPPIPGEVEVFEWLKKNLKGGSLRVKLDKTGLHIVPRNLEEKDKK